MGWLAFTITIYALHYALVGMVVWLLLQDDGLIGRLKSEWRAAGRVPPSNLTIAVWVILIWPVVAFHVLKSIGGGKP